MASIGLIPAKIRPVIIPDMDTIPNIFALSIVGLYEINQITF